jgi:protein-arginine deiminase
MFVGNDRLIIPKPFGPWVEAPGHDNDPNKTNEDNNGYDLFERDLVTKLQQAGINLRCIFIDDWYDYHVVSGEIHCGTNELRAQFNGQAAFGNARYANWWTAVNA